MHMIPVLVLIVILLCIASIIQQSMRYAAYRFYPLVALGVLLAILYWLSSPREATDGFLGIGRYFEWVWNSTTSELCLNGIKVFCRR